MTQFLCILHTRFALYLPRNISDWTNTTFTVFKLVNEIIDYLKLKFNRRDKAVTADAVTLTMTN